MKGNLVFQSDKFSTNQAIKFGREFEPGLYMVSIVTEKGEQQTIKIEKQ